MNLHKLIKRLSEYIPFVIALVVWFIMKPVLRWIDPTAGIDDLGLLQALVFGLVLFYAATAFCWIGLHFMFPRISDYIDGDFKTDFSLNATESRKLWISVVIFGIYFLGAVIIFASVI